MGSRQDTFDFPRGSRPWGSIDLSSSSILSLSTLCCITPTSCLFVQMQIKYLTWFHILGALPRLLCRFYSAATCFRYGAQGTSDSARAATIRDYAPMRHDLQMPALAQSS
ncbi:hypothetical protein PISMIDRAFT_681046 [Pisolithus microcarpus 441]|uniref:Uncharacterized protein n=1 Tax=Pisolithus microcarpus 441 TaxID=765257 RepID=A0A0C9Z6R6_9AGAM|nr:hypothetical protein PISMIDRAFT_681046 [Pisolithus microcarpus 441]